MGASVSRVLLEIKVPLAVLVHGLFKLTWSLRQMNYIEALMGAAPELPPTRARRDAWGRPSVGCSAAP